MSLLPEVDRPSWDEYFMQLAALVSSRSTCLRRKCGAVIVKDRHIVSTGYAGAASGLPHCSEVGCVRDRLGIESGERHELCRGSHAESNAVAYAARYGIAVEGATIYCTTYPCSFCSKVIVGAGIAKVVYGEDYLDPLSEEILANVEVVRYDQSSPGENEGNAEAAHNQETP